MCGITGFIGSENHHIEEVLDTMTDTLSHRGPDDRGIKVFKNHENVVALGHRRLSILDLSKAGHQPMNFQSLWIVFNGEVYNYKEIQEKLIKAGYRFKSDSDTEVILKAWHYWGEDALKHFRGMFAFCMYDQETRDIKLVRDRVGVKPLYYSNTSEYFLFGSELKALNAHPRFSKEIDSRSMGSYFQYGYIPAPYSIFKNTYKVNPGEIITYDCKNGELSKRRYWEASDYYSKPKCQLSYHEAKQKLKTLLTESFEYRMVSDVPVGVFLSGGYDSSAVTALLQKDRTEKLKTFTIGFEEGNNEINEAKQTAKYLGTDHHEMVCTTKEAQELITQIPYYYDEPFGDSSAIPTMLVSKFAKKYVTVALSADGGDEVFGGYGSYQNLYTKLKRLNAIPSMLKQPVSALLNSTEKWIPKNNYRLKHQVKGVSESLNGNEIKEAYTLFKWASRRPISMLQKLFNTEYLEHQLETVDFSNMNDPIETAMLYDYQMYLPDDILVKVDRAGMSVSLEGRDPLLDHKIFEFAASLPRQYKFSPGSGKVILKDIVHEVIPKELMDRPKSGFSIPMSSWLKDGLHDVFEEYTNEHSLNKHFLFNSQYIKEQKKDFYNGELHYTPMMWKLLMFQMWWERWM